MLQEIYTASGMFLRATREMTVQLGPKEAVDILERIQSLEKAAKCAFRGNDLSQLQALSLEICDLGENVKRLLRQSS